MVRQTRPISWVGAALREFEAFPDGAKAVGLVALTVAAEGGKADAAKPMHGLGPGVFEVAIRFRGEAFRVVYSVQHAEEIWVIPRVSQKIHTRHQNAAA